MLRCPLRLAERGMSSLRGACRRRADDIRISSDCGTWAAVFADGKLEFGRVASDERWRGRVGLGPRTPRIRPWEEREAGVALNRTGAVAAVWQGSRISILDGRNGRELRVIHAPIGIDRMSLSDDGTRLAAGLDDRGEKRSGIGVWDTASGRLAAIVPPQKAAWHPQIVWIGDDMIACARANLGAIWRCGLRLFRVLKPGGSITDPSLRRSSQTPVGRWSPWSAAPDPCSC